MNIKKYDGKCVRLTDVEGNVFEGIAEYNSADYCEHEYGREQACLQIVNFLFFPNDIRRIESLEKRQTAFGHFSAPYGKLEVMNVTDGIDSVIEQLECEEPVHVYRMLLCLEAYPHLDRLKGLDKALRDSMILTDDERCRKKAGELLERIMD